MAKMEESLPKNKLNLFIIDIQGFFPATLTILAKNHYHAISIAEEKYPIFKKEEEYRIKGPLDLEKGLAFLIDFEGNVIFRDNEIKDVIDLIHKYNGCNTCGDGDIEIEVESEEIDHEERFL